VTPCKCCGRIHEDGGGVVLRNVDILPQNHMATQPRGPLFKTFETRNTQF